MNMIEKMARVLAAKLSGDEDYWEDWTDETKAALECLKEPTDGMLDAGRSENHDENWPDENDRIFKAMINAALEGK